MPVDAAVIRYVLRRIATAMERVRTQLTNVFLDHLPRHDEFTLTDIATGTQEQDVSWAVPITGDYTVVAVPTTGAAVAGTLTATPKAGTKTATGCTLIVANRSGVTIAAAAFDVLAFPIGG